MKPLDLPTRLLLSWPLSLPMFQYRWAFSSTGSRAAPFHELIELGEGWEKSLTRTPETYIVFSWNSVFFKNKCFLNCCMPLVDFQSTEWLFLRFSSSCIVAFGRDSLFTSPFCQAWREWALILVAFYQSFLWFLQHCALTLLCPSNDFFFDAFGSSSLEID